MGRSRGRGLGGGNDEREQTLNQLLSEMDGFNRDRPDRGARRHQSPRRARLRRFCGRGASIAGWWSTARSSRRGAPSRGARQGQAAGRRRGPRRSARGAHGRVLGRGSRPTSSTRPRSRPRARGGDDIEARGLRGRATTRSCSAIRARRSSTPRRSGAWRSRVRARGRRSLSRSEPSLPIGSDHPARHGAGRHPADARRRSSPHDRSPSWKRGWRC